MTQEVTVFSPATVANVASGFDIFGFALELPGDQITLRFNSKSKVSIIRIEGDGGKLPLNPVKNSAGVSILKLLERLESQQGIDIEIQKKMPLKSGLGSSAASSAGAVFALNALLDFPFSPKELIPFAMEGERVACGSAHADNVAPALLGGFVLVRSYAPLDIISIPYPPSLYCTLIHPHVEVSTEEARKILQKELSLSQLITQTGNAAGLVLGLTQKDFSLISRSLQDVVAEPLRAMLIPGFHEIKEAALEAGALGCSISGSGPSIFALSTEKRKAESIGQAMQNACLKHHIKCAIYLSPINDQGVRIL